MGRYVDADLNSMKELSHFFEEKSSSLQSILSSMESTIADIESSWKGGDSSEFIENATSYTQALHSDVVDLKTFSSDTKRYLNKYENKIAKYMEILRRG